MFVNDVWLVTGGAGFIGSNFVKMVLKNTDHKVVVVDKLTYAGSFENLYSCINNSRLEFVREDIRARDSLERIFNSYKPSHVINFAAETHVDRSIDDPSPFVQTNIVGTFELLEATKKYITRLNRPQDFKRFLQVSTDEVFGSTQYPMFTSDIDSFTEMQRYNPSSVYAATKAGADHLVSAYRTTYNVPTISTYCTNNYGPHQLPEKFVPVVILNAINGRPIPVYGDGFYFRDWLYVDDHCRALIMILDNEYPSYYNISFSNDTQISNKMLIHEILHVLEKIMPCENNPNVYGFSYEKLIEHVQDRPGHDLRYSLDSSRIRELGWKPLVSLEEGLYKTIEWYIANEEWCDSMKLSTKRQGLK